ncbi:YfbU family protein [Ralstonia pseudosolanacearum]|uniref:YfbU family protein n=1 Tax=Ralstonia pseudosolanacearum TaxID=1310165 RepID=UPI0027040BA1|nr:YfbU family protein [Ralstonia pseudosolanacearum]MDO3616486.1 YfbU family protein [Ralstonia pseudosolanacearum]
MKLSNAEKLIISMLADVHEKLGLADYRPDFLKAAINTGNTWALSWDLQGIVGDSPDETPAHVREVSKYLMMWTTLEVSFNSLDPAAKQRVAAEAERFPDARLPGFDGNNESDLHSVACFFVEDMGRFAQFKGRDLNSHTEMRDTYRKMHDKFRAIQTARSHRPNLNAEELISVLKADHLS